MWAEETAMPNRAADELLTATQVGSLIGRSGRTVVRLAEAGKLTVAVKLPGPNGAHLFRKADVDAFLKATA
jgi:hypothetical protein